MRMPMIFTALLLAGRLAAGEPGGAGSGPGAAPPQKIAPDSLAPNTWTRVRPAVVLPKDLAGSYEDAAWTVATCDRVGKRRLVGCQPLGSACGQGQLLLGVLAAPSPRADGLSERETLPSGRR